MLMNHYLLLGLQSDADQRQIKTAYRRMAKRFHPDTNQGSEAATELFRQLNEAYRILTNPALRNSYDLELSKEEQATQQRNNATKLAAEKAAKKGPAARDPQQKFNHFLNSLLDALFETPEPPPGTSVRDRAPPRKKPATNTRRNPDFDFYYYLAVERKKPSYTCGDDGVYRRDKSSKAQKTGKAATGFAKAPGSHLLIIILSSLWGFLNP